LTRLANFDPGLPHNGQKNDFHKGFFESSVENLQAWLGIEPATQDAQ